ncbi:uncharacterized protein LOC121628165 isoform X1 [Melanotaenia boesemani]|uniref:uncharacterized protein LOC121628165 isoform X1 n=1 Tax=Melanotaenia boesemani TaxID=1250792 RepID=UPI001C03C3EB|nr:uncharacterized protein LOC121628165 isoform X1 [Melanotaenia boesemani]XP_041823030.1 uncharacterized protein LOC121628165 isoform X1 [Melanotaenia boesemani]
MSLSVRSLAGMHPHTSTHYVALLAQHRRKVRSIKEQDVEGHNIPVNPGMDDEHGAQGGEALGSRLDPLGSDLSVYVTTAAAAKKWGVHFVEEESTPPLAVVPAQEPDKVGLVTITTPRPQAGIGNHQSVPGGLGYEHLARITSLMVDQVWAAAWNTLEGLLEIGKVVSSYQTTGNTPVVNKVDFTPEPQPTVVTDGQPDNGVVESFTLPPQGLDTLVNSYHDKTLKGGEVKDVKGQPEVRGFRPSEDYLWKEAMANTWYRWAWLSVKEMTSEECIWCSKAPGAPPVVVPDKYSSWECAQEQRRVCEEEAFKSTTTNAFFGLPMCGMKCRLLYGAQRMHGYLNKYRGYKIQELCVPYQVANTAMAPPTVYEVDYNAAYECFASGGFLQQNGIMVGNTTVRCNVTWVLSWFPESGVSPLFITKAVWFENPEPPHQDCQNMSITVPTLFWFGDQSHAVADSFWLCGNNLLRSTLPPSWVGLCATVRLKVPAMVVYNGANNILHLKRDKGALRRSRRQVSGSHEVYRDAIEIAKGIPVEFSARNEVVAGIESILPWITVNKNVNWINYIYYNQQRLFNHTIEGLSALGEQLHETSRLALQNRQALDWLLADKGGICQMFGEDCCTFIPANTAPDGSFTSAMEEIIRVGREVREHAGKSDWSLDWLDQLMADWKNVLIKVGVGSALVLILLFLFGMCIVPALRRAWRTSLKKQTSVIMAAQLVRTELDL